MMFYLGGKYQKAKFSRHLDLADNPTFQSKETVSSLLLPGRFDRYVLGWHSALLLEWF